MIALATAETEVLGAGFLFELFEALIVARGGFAEELFGVAKATNFSGGGNGLPLWTGTGADDR